MAFNVFRLRSVVFATCLWFLSAGAHVLRHSIAHHNLSGAIEVAEVLEYTSPQPGQKVASGIKLRILPVGDSITAGAGSSTLNGYRKSLRDALSENEVVFAGTEHTGLMTDGYHAGWPGKTIKYITDHIMPSLEQQPNVILLHAGTNDMSGNLQVATEGNDPRKAANRLGGLIDMMVEECPDAVIIVGIILNHCMGGREPQHSTYQDLIPGVVAKRSGDKKVIAADFRTISTDLLGDCVHPNDIGYNLMGMYWYDFILNLPNGWLKAPIGKDPHRHDYSNENGGIDNTQVGTIDRGANPVQKTSYENIKSAFSGAGRGGKRKCLGKPRWYSTGMIDSGATFAYGSAWQYAPQWPQQGKYADGMGLDRAYAGFHDMDNDGKADYVWVNPETGEIICWLNKGPNLWEKANPESEESKIGDGHWSADGVQFADMNGDGFTDLLRIDSTTGNVDVHFNYGSADPADILMPNGWTWVYGGKIAGPVLHANWDTLRFPDINGDGRGDYVVKGRNGALRVWLNIGTQGGTDIIWVSQGYIAEGGSQDIFKLRFADLNGDGRDDYVNFDSNGGMTAFLNQPSWIEGKPYWRGPQRIAEGVGEDPENIFLADMDGDGSDDYVWISPNTSVHVWWNRDTTRSVMPSTGFRLADMDGDGLDDLVYLDPVTGAPIVYVNKGPQAADVLGWRWEKQNNGFPIATGAAPASQVQFADMNGDGFDDYIVVNPTSGNFEVIFNLGAVSGDETQKQRWKWKTQGQDNVMGLPGPGKNVRFADIDGDGRADYIYLQPGGRAEFWLNQYDTNSGVFSWNKVDALEVVISQRPEEITFHDIDGDGKADCVWTMANGGSVEVWYNSYPSSQPWARSELIAYGVGSEQYPVSGSIVRWAKLQNTGRSSYVVVDPSSNAIAAWLNGCDDF